MQNETINPIRHSTLGTLGGTAAGAAGGAVKTGAKTLLYVTIAGAVLGGAWGLGLFAAAGIAGATAAWTIGGIIGGGVLGAFTGLFAAPIAGGIGAITGGSRAASRMRDENGAHNVMSAELQAYQAQALAAQQPTTIYAPSAANHNYAGASTKNMAPLSIQGGTGQDLGTINGMQLQRA